MGVEGVGYLHFLDAADVEEGVWFELGDLAVSEVAETKGFF